MPKWLVFYTFTHTMSSIYVLFQNSSVFVTDGGVVLNRQWSLHSLRSLLFPLMIWRLPSCVWNLLFLEIIRMECGKTDQKQPPRQPLPVCIQGWPYCSWKRSPLCTCKGHAYFPCAAWPVRMCCWPWLIPAFDTIDRATLMDCLI